MSEEWDVAVVGAGPAGLSAAAAAARAGARTIVLERAAHPRYKTCGGGLVGTSLAALAADFTVPESAKIDSATFTLRGGHMFTRHRDDGPLLTMVLREEFDDALRGAAVAAGAVMRENSTVRAIEQNCSLACARLMDGDQVRAKVLIGADGSASIAARHVGVEFMQTDLGLELEISAPEKVFREWSGRILIDWGPIPGSYGWLFPKENRLAVGFIAPRGHSDLAAAYLRTFISRLRLSDCKTFHESGHLTRCRARNSPLRRGRVLVAGDAAGLLEPWTREGISFALRSGSMAGEAGARAAVATDTGDLGTALDEYAASVNRRLVPEMDAGRKILAVFIRHPGVVHRGLSTATGWRVFSKYCRGYLAFPSLVNRPLLGPTISLLGRL